MPYSAAQNHTSFSAVNEVLFGKYETFDYFDPVTKLFFPSLFLAAWLELSQQMRVISFVWVKSSRVVAEFARIRYDLFYDFVIVYALFLINTHCFSTRIWMK